MFFTAVCDHHLCVNTRAQGLVEKQFFVMTLYQLNAHWHQNLTTTSLKAVQANGRQVFLRSCAPLYRSAHGHRKEGAAGLEEIAALVLQHQLVPSAATATRMHSQNSIRNGIVPARAFPQQAFMWTIPVWSTSTLDKSMKKMLLRSNKFVL